MNIVGGEGSDSSQQRPTNVIHLDCDPQQPGVGPGQERRLRRLRHPRAGRVQPLPRPRQPALRAQPAARICAGQVRRRHGRDLPAGRGGPHTGSGRGAERKVRRHWKERKFILAASRFAHSYHITHSPHANLQKCRSIFQSSVRLYHKFTKQIAF